MIARHDRKDGLKCAGWFLLVLVFSSQTLLADKRVPGVMVGGDFEMVLSPTLAAGGMGDTPRSAYRISANMGGGFTGALAAPDCTDQPGDPCTLEMGYGFFEFYSDRLPVFDLSLSVNGGPPGELFTNNPDITLGIKFRDDLSGLKFATVEESFGSWDPLPLDLEGNNLLYWRLGQSRGITEPLDGPYGFKFTFKDYAGNGTDPAIESQIILDRTPPTAGQVLLNNGDKFTSSPVVAVKLFGALDNQGPQSSGVTAVRLSTDTAEVKSWRLIPFYLPGMSVEWTLDQTVAGQKYVFAQFRDGAGNWSVALASDSITYGAFAPGGQLAFELVPGEVVQGPVYVETNRTSVSLLMSWNESSRDEVKEIIVRRQGAEDKNFPAQPGLETPPAQKEEYRIAEEGGPDGLVYMEAVFKDFQGNPSLPIGVTIYFNQNQPEKPLVEGVVPSSDSLTFQVKPQGATADVRFIQFKPTQFSEDQGATFSTVPWSSQEPYLIYVDTGLRPNSAYEYIITAHEELEHSFPADTPAGGFYTLAEKPKVKTPPRGMEINVILVEWDTANNPPGTEYFLEWSKTQNFDCFFCHTDWVSDHLLFVDGLEIGTTYYFRVRARNKQEIETETVSLGAGATRSYIPPLPPSAFSTVAVSSNSINWQWIREPSTEDGFVIRSSTEGEVARIPLVPTVMTYLYKEGNLTPNTTYFRKIASYNGFRGYSESTALIANSVVTYPAPPERLAGLVVVVGSEMLASWGVGGNPPGTEYLAQISGNLEFTDLADIPVEDSGWITETNFRFPGLKPSTTYYIRAFAKHRASSYRSLTYLGAGKTQTFNHGQELTVNLLEGWELIIPPLAFEEDFGIFMEGDPNLFQSVDMNTLLTATEKARRDSNGYRFPISGGLVEVRVTDVQGERLDPLMKKNAALRYFYPDSNPDDSLVDALSTYENLQGRAPLSASLNLPVDQDKQIRASTLRVWVLDPESKSWIKVPANEIVLEKSFVESNVRVLGVFAVMGASSLDVDQVVAYPVPFRPNGPAAGVGPGQTGTNDAGIRFVNIPQEGVIKIFTLNGDMVKEIALDGGIWARWDTLTSGGEKAASGTYYWVTEVGGNKKVGKLMIIR